MAKVSPKGQKGQIFQSTVHEREQQFQLPKSLRQGIPTVDSTFTKQCSGYDMAPHIIYLQ